MLIANLAFSNARSAMAGNPNFLTAEYFPLAISGVSLAQQPVVARRQGSVIQLCLGCGMAQKKRATSEEAALERF